MKYFSFRRGGFRFSSGAYTKYVSIEILKPTKYKRKRQADYKRFNKAPHSK
ncbi:hypothetical protein [Campylobacter mucosalis]|uniref:hypothetical protein n=1 Tax=Campylobacter mucosalis TaxID=202 RepID=UPI001553A287|nr:hypothetical protein [Campylobacter mucosalis]